MTGVAQVMNSLGRSGLEYVASRLAQAFAQPDCDSHLLVTSRVSGDLFDEMLGEVRVEFFRRSWPLDLSPIRRLGRYLEENDIQLVHSHNWVSAYQVWAALRMSSARPVHVLHDHCGSYDEWRGPLDRVVLGSLDAVFTVTEPVRERFARLLGLGADRALRLPNGVALGPEGTPWTGRPTVIQVANFHVAKAHDTAFRSAALLREHIPDLHWVCVGDLEENLEYTGRMRELFDALELEGCVELVGGCSDVRERLREANVGVLTSDTEGLPVSILEYMAESLPVVMTDVGQAPRLLEESQAGIVVPPQDPESFRDALAGLLGDPSEAATLGQRGREYVGRSFSDEVMIDSVRALYRDLLREGGQVELAERLRG